MHPPPPVCFCNFSELLVWKVRACKLNNTTCTSSVHQVAASSATLKLTENPGKAEVTQLDDLVFGDEDVLRLDVSVNALHQENRPNRNKQGGGGIISIETKWDCPLPPHWMLSFCSSRYYLLRLCDTLTAGQPGGRNSCKRREKRGCKADGRVGAGGGRGGGREGGDRRNSKNKAERLQRDRSGHSRSACGRSSQPGASATLCFWRGAREHCGPGRGGGKWDKQTE